VDHKGHFIDSWYYFEKRIVNAEIGEIVARYAEEGGIPLPEDVTVFNAAADRLFEIDGKGR
jgi:hypothetical protein